MWSKLKLFNGGIVDASTFVFHDQAAHHRRVPYDGPRVRTTSVAILFKTGQLFIGTSVCSESETFTRAKGYSLALRLAIAKAARYQKWATGLTPKYGDIDSIICTRDGTITSKDVFHEVEARCLDAKMDKYMDMLADRAALIEKLIENSCGGR